MSGSNPKEKTNAVWSFFSSVRLTITLLIILAIVSIFGTLIPQHEESAHFVHSLSPALIQVFNALQLFDIYHSLWFRIIIGALALNLMICSIDRFPLTLKRYRTQEKPGRAKPFENLLSHRSFSVNGEMGNVASAVAGLLKRHYGHVQVTQSEAEGFVFAEKGRYALFGVYLVHLSVLLILVGGITGSFLGFEAYVNIPEGEAVDTVFLRKGAVPKRLSFAVECEKFTVDFYDNGAPKEYRSDLSFIEDGQVVLRTGLLVNHPVTFRGITFYQASYGTIPGDTVHLRISQEGRGNEPALLNAEKGRLIELPGKDGQFEVTDIRSDFMNLGPAAHIQIKPPEGEWVRFWVFQHQDMIRERFPGIFERSPRFHFDSYKPYAFSLAGIESKFYTGVQVNDDPGVFLVWMGCFVMMGGFFFTFFTSHKRVWIRLSKKKGRLTVSVAGRADKNPVGMDRELDQMTDRLRGLLTA